MDGEHAVRRIGRRRVACHRHVRQVVRPGVEPGLAPRLRAEMMKGFGQDAAETAASADEGDVA